MTVSEQETRGRKSKYKPEYCDDVIEHLSAGKSFASFAGIVRVHRDTLFEWAKVHEEFSEAVCIGRAVGMSVWENRLAGQAESGEGNTAAIIFAMKNLYRDDWADRIVSEHTGEGGGPIVTKDISAMTTAQIEAELAALESGG